MVLSCLFNKKRGYNKLSLNDDIVPDSAYIFLLSKNLFANIFGLATVAVQVSVLSWFILIAMPGSKHYTGPTDFTPACPSNLVASDVASTTTSEDTSGDTERRRFADFTKALRSYDARRRTDGGDSAAAGGDAAGGDSAGGDSAGGANAESVGLPPVCAAKGEPTIFGIFVGMVIVVTIILPDLISGIWIWGNGKNLRWTFVGVCLIAVSVLAQISTVLYLKNTTDSDDEIFLACVSILFVLDFDESAYRVLKLANPNLVERIVVETNGDNGCIGLVADLKFTDWAKKNGLKTAAGGKIQMAETACEVETTCKGGQWQPETPQN